MLFTVWVVANEAQAARLAPLLVVASAKHTGKHSSHITDIYFDESTI